jgi:hypothetical protein
VHANTGHPVGITGPDYDRRIDSLGFQIVDECTLLGYVIDNKGALVDENLCRVREKIYKIVNFWRIFNLSIIGKLTVLKTLALPLINYVATVLTPKEEWLVEMQGFLNDFLRHGIKIRAEKVTKKVEEGGLGFFDLKEFISGLQCSWINRALRNLHDNWSQTLSNVVGGILNLCKDDISNFGPVLSGIVINYINFCIQYGKNFSTFANVPVYENTEFRICRQDEDIFDTDFFETFLP